MIIKYQFKFKLLMENKAPNFLFLLGKQKTGIIILILLCFFLHSIQICCLSYQTLSFCNIKQFPFFSISEYVLKKLNDLVILQFLLL